MTGNEMTGEAPPQELPPPPYKLHKPAAVGLATFLGSPVAGGIVMAINYRRLGKPQQRVMAILLPVLATVAMLAVFWNIEGPGGRLPAIVGVVVMFLVAKKLQEKDVDDHVARGGALASMWAAAGIGALCLVVLAVVLIGGIYLVEPSYESVNLNANDTVYYGGEATSVDALWLGNKLTEEGWFGHAGADAVLECEYGRYSVAILMTGGYHDPQRVAEIRALGEMLAERFGRPMDMKMMDLYMDPQNQIEIP